MAKKAWTVWFIGLHGSGKTTIADNAASVLRKRNVPVVVLDGDEVRKTISSDLDYSLEDRNRHMARVADLCGIITNSGVLAIACVASPTEKSRKYAKKRLRNIITVYVRCPIEICEVRDVKRHYKKAREKQKGFEDFLGINIPFEEPKNPDLILDTDKSGIKKCVDKLIKLMEDKKVVKRP